jgi:hypothetical protein
MKQDDITTLLQPEDVAQVQLLQQHSGVEHFTVADVNVQMERDANSRAQAWETLQRTKELLTMAKASLATADAAFLIQLEAVNAARAKLYSDRKAYLIQKALKSKKAFKAKNLKLMQQKDVPASEQKDSNEPRPMPEHVGEYPHTDKTTAQIVEEALNTEKEIEAAKVELDAALKQAAAEQDAAAKADHAAAVAAGENKEDEELHLHDAEQHEGHEVHDGNKIEELDEALAKANDN